MDDRRRMRRRRWFAATVVALCRALVVAAWTDIDARTRSRNEQAALAAADSHLDWLRHRMALTQFAKAVTKAKRDALQSSITTTMGQLAVTNGSLSNTNVHAYVQGVGIDTLQTCWGGVKNAFSQIAAKNNAQAAEDVSASRGPVRSWPAARVRGLVYPFDFPDPVVILVGQTYYAYATNSVAGNIQIIDSNDLLPLDLRWATRCRAFRPGQHPTTPGHPLSPRWAVPYLLYYAVDVAGTGARVHLRGLRQADPGTLCRQVDGATGVPEVLGGSIDPASFTDTNGTPYLVWKSGGPGRPKSGRSNWAPSGTSFVARHPAPPLVWCRTSPGRPGPSRPRTWSPPVGTTTCSSRATTGTARTTRLASPPVTGPLGPCSHALRRTPSCRAERVWTGPGGESVFADTSGDFWIAFHAWVPGAVGFPNSRDLYLRRLTFSGSVPVVATSG